MNTGEIISILLLILAAAECLLLLLLFSARKQDAARINALQEEVENLDALTENSGVEILRGLTDRKEEMAALRKEHIQVARELRDEFRSEEKAQLDSILSRLLEITTLQNAQLEALGTRIERITQASEERIAGLKKEISEELNDFKKMNSAELTEMRQLVDEKLQESLERRLGESFKLINEQLEAVHKGLGEMQTLAVGVGDLKKVLTNVKNRGIWGEIQLGNLLEDLLNPQQYAVNIATIPNSSERVEYAMRLPGKNGNDDPVWLPIDAKFPQESYLRLTDALEAGDKAAAELAAKQLEDRMKQEAKKIHEKYVMPPYTTDFAILFLPTESLYAEIVRRPGLLDELQRKYRIVVSGPSTMAALLNSFALGFRTLAIEAHSEEIWETLNVIKTEFHRFGELIDKTRKKLEEASTSMDSVSGKTRNIEKHLAKIQEFPYPGDEKEKLMHREKLRILPDEKIDSEN